MKRDDKIVFRRNGKRIEGRVLAIDSDARAKIWVVDAQNPDVNYMVDPSEGEHTAPADTSADSEI